MLLSRGVSYAAAAPGVGGGVRLGGALRRGVGVFLLS